MSGIVIGWDALARIVIAADEIRKNVKAKGEEAQRQFEVAIQRNKHSFGQIVSDLGGMPQDPKPPEIPPDPPSPPNPPTPPVEPVPPPRGDFYEKWITDPGDPALMNNDYVYGRDEDAMVYIHRNGPMGGFPGGPTRLVRVVEK